MFFKLLELMNWITAQCRKQFYNLAFGTNFRYFGKNCSIEISGQVKIGKNVYIGDHVNLISVHDKFHRTLILSGFCLLKIAKISLNSSFFPKPIKR